MTQQTGQSGFWTNLKSKCIIRKEMLKGHSKGILDKQFQNETIYMCLLYFELHKELSEWTALVRPDPTHMKAQHTRERIKINKKKKESIFQL